MPETTPPDRDKRIRRTVFLWAVRDWIRAGVATCLAFGAVAYALVFIAQDQPEHQNDIHATITPVTYEVDIDESRNWIRTGFAYVATLAPAPQEPWDDALPREARFSQSTKSNEVGDLVCLSRHVGKKSGRTTYKIVPLETCDAGVAPAQ